MVLLTLFSFGQDNTLFRIIEDGKVGYINKEGEVIIQPRFIVGKSFHEGLAAVRENGLYGYIDTTGNYVIPPQYDYAEIFYGNSADAYIGGKRYYLFTCGGELKSSRLKTYNLEGDLFVIYGENDKAGIWNCVSNKMIIDTIYDAIVDYSDGTLIVFNYGEEIIDHYSQTFNYSVIDTSGNVLIPFDKFNSIYKFYDGIAIAGHNRDDYPYYGVTGPIDTKGNFFFQMKLAEHERLSERFNEGLSPITLSNKRSSSSDEIVDDDYKNTHEGYINLKGELVLNDTLIEEVTEFSNRRAFIKMRDEDKYWMIDTKMEKVGNHYFEYTYPLDIDNNSYTLVRSNSKWGIIDSTCTYIISPKYHSIRSIGINEKFFFYANEEIDGVTLYGLAKLDGTIITEPLFNEVSNYSNGLFSVEIENRLSYINTKGEIIWQEKEDIAALYFNIDYINFGLFYANKESKDISLSEESFIKDSLNFIVNTNTFDSLQFNLDKLRYKYLFHPVVLANLTKDDVKIRAADGKIYVYSQAMDEDGNWRDISIVNTGRCANGIGNTSLEQDKYWQLKVPAYQGSFKTKLRLKLKYVNSEYSTYPDQSDEGMTIYSNEYEGSVNPGQFWKEISIIEFARTTNLRDPYYRH